MKKRIWKRAYILAGVFALGSICLLSLFFACSDMMERYRIGLCYPHTPNDAGLSLASADPLEACRAIGLGSEVISARWVLPDGADPPAAQVVNYHLGHAIMENFGANIHPQEGARFMALSTGNAQLAGQTGCNTNFNKQYSNLLPPGFPAVSTSCTPVTYGSANDGITLEAVIRVPRYACGFLFDFKLYTAEYPQWKCTTYADHFIVIVSPPSPGSINENVCFAPDGPISINTGFITVCATCPDGDAELAGTGFEGLGASPWLETIASVQGGATITVRFSLWDNTDGNYDTVILIDNWRWVAFSVDAPRTYVKGNACPCGQ